MVVVMTTSNRWLGLFGEAVILSSAGVLASTSLTSSSPLPLNCSIDSLGDGFCDSQNNNLICAFDYGDCCDGDCDCIPDLLGDGFCDSQNNNLSCGYDAGDCCACTCSPDGPFTCDESSFSCVDPSAPCVNDDDITVDALDCVNALKGDGFCHPQNNREACDWDGGDCCACTCNMDPGFYSRLCGVSGYACVDPSAECVDDDIVTIDMLDICSTLEIGDGFCNEANNSADCAYDGGDCCECTCQPSEINRPETDLAPCGQIFFCIDPAAPCLDAQSGGRRRGGRLTLTHLFLVLLLGAIHVTGFLSTAFSLQCIVDA